MARARCRSRDTIIRSAASCTRITDGHLPAQGGARRRPATARVLHTYLAPGNAPAAVLAPVRVDRRVEVAQHPAMSTGSSPTAALTSCATPCGSAGRTGKTSGRVDRDLRPATMWNVLQRHPVLRRAGCLGARRPKGPAHDCREAVALDNLKTKRLVSCRKSATLILECGICARDRLPGYDRRQSSGVSTGSRNASHLEVRFAAYANARGVCAD